MYRYRSAPNTSEIALLFEKGIKGMIVVYNLIDPMPDTTSELTRNGTSIKLIILLSLFNMQSDSFN
jgi:hypothetical protein